MRSSWGDRGRLYQFGKGIPEHCFYGRRRTRPTLLDNRKRTPCLRVLEPHAAKRAEHGVFVVPALALRDPRIFALISRDSGARLIERRSGQQIS